MTGPANRDSSLSTKAGRAVAGAFAALPGLGLLARGAALAPPALKSPAIHRIVSAILIRRRNDAELVETNLGIPGGLRLLLPAGKHHLLYGTPDQILPERATLDLARALARDAGAFLDVGANEGLFTFSIAASLGPAGHGKIHLFEPDSTLFERLKVNLARNGIAARANNLAVSGETGVQTFYRNISDDLSGSLSLHFDGPHEIVAVDMETITLADYLNRNDLRNACVKIDVEGAGLQVWEGAREALPRIDALIMEIIGPEVEAGVPAKIIRDSGWNAWYVRDYELVPSRDGEYEYVAPFYNWLFTRKSMEELGRDLAGTKFRLMPAGARPA